MRSAELVAARTDDNQKAHEVLTSALQATLTDPGIQSRVVSSLKADAPRMLSEHRRINARFMARLHKRWGTALDLFYIVQVASEEIGADVYRAACSDELNRDERGLLEAVSGLHARACRVSFEVYELLEAGFPKGAQARARTLHELAVVACVLSKLGRMPGHEDIGRRFAAFDHVSNWKDAQEHQKYADRLGQDPLTPEEMKQIKAARDAAAQEFPGLDARLGWAGDVPGLKSRTLAELEVLAGIDHLRPYYSWASHEVHANPKGSRLNLVDGSDGQMKLTGRTNTGLADPAQSALIALHQTTSALITCPGASTPSGVLGTQVVAALLDDACQEFARISHGTASRAVSPPEDPISPLRSVGADVAAVEVLGWRTCGGSVESRERAFGRTRRI
ncbi:MAG: hypothetical protein HGA44_06010 [Cellulomonadaceae bacterium]|nr:hypothetical protein [Cellulomonadaceae bacterium]